MVDCGSENIIYLITCTKCGIQYVGETVNTLRFRMNAHRQSIKDKKETLVANHFNNTCSLDHLSVQPFEIIGGDGRSEKSAKQRKLSTYSLPIWAIVVMDKIGRIEMTMILHL